MTATQETTTKKTKRNPILMGQAEMIPQAEAEEIQREHAEAVEADEDKTKNEYKYWAQIHNEDECEVSLMGFPTKSAMQNFLKEHPECTIVGEFIVRGYAKPITTSQTVRF